jgi:hypothetical protein
LKLCTAGNQDCCGFSHRLQLVASWKNGLLKDQQ